MSSVCPAGDIADEGPRQRVGRPAAERVGLGVRGDEGVAASRGARVVGAPVRTPASTCSSAPRNASRWGQASWVMTTRAEMQLKPALFTNIVAMWSAW